MEHPAGDAPNAAVQLGYDRRLRLEFHGSRVTSDAGLLAFRELDDTLGLTEFAGGVLADTRTGRNGCHTLTAQLRQAIFGRLAGYEDVNDADWLAHDPAMRWVVGGRAVTEQAAPVRSEERRVGKECRSRWSPYHSKKNHIYHV